MILTINTRSGRALVSGGVDVADQVPDSTNMVMRVLLAEPQTP